MNVCVGRASGRVKRRTMMNSKNVTSTISVTGRIRKMPDRTLVLPPDTCRGLLVVGSVALGALTLLAGPDTKNLGPRTRGHFMPEDFESQRADGRYEIPLRSSKCAFVMGVPPAS